MFAPTPIGTLGVVEVDVERIPVAASYPLRQAVLRPHQTIDEVAAPVDDDPESATFGVIDRSTGSVVGTATVLRAEAPMAKDGADFTADGAGGDAAGAPAWRLRYMATRDDLRGQGLGSHALEAALAHVAAEGGGTASEESWCGATHACPPSVSTSGRLPDLGGAVGLALGPARGDVEDCRHGRWP